MRHAALALVLIACALPATVAEAAAPSPKGQAPAATAAGQVVQQPALQEEALAAINELRRARGLRELRLSGALSRTALAHSVSMATHGFFDHAGWDGTAFWQRIKPGYPPRGQGAWSVGENLVWASPDLSAVQAIELWLKSPPHRKNLLGPWREVGLGAVHALEAPGVYDGLDVTILTADFGAR